MKEKVSVFSRRDFLKYCGVAFVGLFFQPERNSNYLKEGDIPISDRITFKDKLPAYINHKVLYLPSESAFYDRKLYQVKPDYICWHWDGGFTPKKEDKSRVYMTYNALLGRTNNGDPVATHFTVGPNSVLQMLSISESYIIQGRLTEDRGISDILKAKSLRGIQIETTGSYFDINPPMPSQDQTLIILTTALMKQFKIPFSKITGHLERSPEVNKQDPGILYLKKMRIKLLKYLIGNNLWKLINNPSCWNFYKEVKRNGKTILEGTQTKEEILSGLSFSERNLISFLFKDNNYLVNLGD